MTLDCDAASHEAAPCSRNDGALWVQSMRVPVMQCWPRLYQPRGDAAGQALGHMRVQRRGRGRHLCPQRVARRPLAARGARGAAPPHAIQRTPHPRDLLYACDVCVCGKHAVRTALFDTGGHEEFIKAFGQDTSPERWISAGSGETHLHALESGQHEAQ